MLRIFIAAMLAACLSGCAVTLPTGTALLDAEPTRPPESWLDYCRRTPSDTGCQVTPLTAARWRQLQAAQADVLAIRWQSDQDRFGMPEYWAVATVAGDCEDMALAARAKLLDQGWRPGSLRLTKAFTETLEMHVVLTVEVIHPGKRMTLVIDNRSSGVTTWDQLAARGYWFILRQAATPGDWAAIARTEQNGPR